MARELPPQYLQAMRAQLKHLHSPDVDLREYRPAEVDNFSFLLQAMIGPEGTDASESFDIVVCTPKWLSSSRNDPLWGRHMMIVLNYDLGKIRQIISSYCSSCVGNDWQSIASLLSRIGKWEFEDYRK
ncbi:MAG TPA: immunity 8 family protein [Candidatus Limnocylindria bacterium]|nr:immunity 8 family protein [Candidatus Limnocylindria bacterium]